MIKWKKDALDHAKECDPSESCGLLVKIKNKNKYWACKNICTNSIDCFVIDPNDWIEAEDSGDLQAIIHSHTQGSTSPSEADVVGCNTTGLTWYIVNPKTEEWTQLQPQ